MDTQQIYFVYIVECADGTLYAGLTTDLERRVGEHNNGRTGARYTRGRRPVRILYAERFSTLSDALKREARIKRMRRRQKLLLLKSDPGHLPEETR